MPWFQSAAVFDSGATCVDGKYILGSWKCVSIERTPVVPEGMYLCSCLQSSVLVYKTHGYCRVRDGGGTDTSIAIRELIKSTPVPPVTGTGVVQTSRNFRRGAWKSSTVLLGVGYRYEKSSIEICMSAGYGYKPGSRSPRVYGLPRHNFGLFHTHEALTFVFVVWSTICDCARLRWRRSRRSGFRGGRTDVPHVGKLASASMG